MIIRLGKIRHHFKEHYSPCHFLVILAFLNIYFYSYVYICALMCASTCRYERPEKAIKSLGKGIA